MRWLPALASASASAALALAFAGCALEPAAAGQEPDRPSPRVAPPLFAGEPLWLNGTAHVSLLPPRAGAAVPPGEPHNCFAVDDTGEEDSYLGGFLVALEWDAASAATAELNVTVDDLHYPFSSWSAQGASPLRLVAADAEERPVRTPFTVTLAAGGGAAVPGQAVVFQVMVGALESRLAALAWTACPLAPPLA